MRETLEPCCHAAGVATAERAYTADEEQRLARRRRRGLLDRVIDAHTHLFPEPIYRALARWFDAHAWHIRFQGDAEAVLDELARAGATRMVALVYAHKPGMAESLNGFLGELCRRHAGVVGVGTVLPGEPDAPRIVRDAIACHGLRGIKLHCHVQRVAVDDPRVMEVLAACEALGVPAVVHSGRQPAVSGYGVDPLAICDVARTERVLRALPRLRLVVPHLGSDEFTRHFALLDEHEHLHLDTAMLCADWLATETPWPTVERHAARVMYGSDFPITPYATTREIDAIARRFVDDAALDRVLRGTARSFWGID